MPNTREHLIAAARLGGIARARKLSKERIREICWNASMAAVEKLTSEQRRAIATKASHVRWGIQSKKTARKKAK